MKRAPRAILITVLAALLLAIIAVTARVWWASRPPRLPERWSTNSVWMVGSRSPLALWPQGAWVDCWLETGRNVDRCKFGDYRGRIFYEHDYSTCDVQGGVPTDKLELHNQGSIWILRLEDGTPLFQTPCPVRHGPEVIQRP